MKSLNKLFAVVLLSTLNSCGEQPAAPAVDAATAEPAKQEVVSKEVKTSTQAAVEAPAAKKQEQISSKTMTAVEPAVQTVAAPVEAADIEPANGLAVKLTQDGCVDPDMSKIPSDVSLTLCDGTLASGTYTTPAPQVVERVVTNTVEVPVERIVTNTVTNTVEVPVDRIVEVERIVTNTVTVTNTVEVPVEVAFNNKNTVNQPLATWLAANGTPADKNRVILDADVMYYALGPNFQIHKQAPAAAKYFTQENILGCRDLVNPTCVLKDNGTGLSWTNPEYLGLGSETNLITYPLAKQQCEALTRDGHDDWRLPTFAELMQFHLNGAAVLHQNVNIAVRSGYYLWTSTSGAAEGYLYTNNASYKYLVNLKDGLNRVQASETAGTISGGTVNPNTRAICVR